MIITIRQMGAYWPIAPRSAVDIVTPKTAEAPSLEDRTTATSITTQLLMIAFLGQDECRAQHPCNPYD